MEAQAAKTTNELTANDLLAISRERTLNADEIHQVKSLLDELITTKNNRPLKTPELVSMERLKTLLPESADTSPGAPEQNGSVIGREIEKGFNQAVPDKDAFLIPYSSIIEVSNPRKKLRNIPELLQAVKEAGRIKHPISVEKIEGGYKLIGGHRRKAVNAILIEEDPKKWGMMPARLHTTEQFFIDQLLDNKHRDDLAPIEEAEAYQDCMDEYGYNQKSLAKKLSLSERHISDRLALLKLPENAQELINSGEIAPNSKMARKMIEQAKAGKVVDVEAMTASATTQATLANNPGSVATKATADSGAAVRAPKVSISKDSAIVLCELLTTLASKKRALIDIDLEINNKSPKKDIISILEQRPFDILDAYK